jgi:hypothetical protein
MGDDFVQALIPYPSFRWRVRYIRDIGGVHNSHSERTLQQLFRPTGGGKDIWRDVPEVVE